MAAFQIIRESQPAQTGLDETTQHLGLGISQKTSLALLPPLLLSQGARHVCTTMPGGIVPLALKAVLFESC